ncbi:hypothetical protein MOO46_04530 [Apilactobacillus apisilvae]|uniref:Uncharacterized protein n=1 Tax=Apilactobacillus apisilvae TaxID=2923364 RepID=A0ABY4PG65_9LACO|nr:hypothetical protein [Apilactobacillus apisilvae]UQS84526.1 hypothetical protein MOO46_04530 [Apilactobacillus apisilvae]
MKKKLSSVLIMTASLVCLGLASNVSVSANNEGHNKKVHKVVKKKQNKKQPKHTFKPVINKWYNGTPKGIRGTWYHNDSNPRYNAYITYNENQSAGNYFENNADDTFTPEYAKGLINIRYSYLGNNKYKIRGVEYLRTDSNNRPVSEHEYYEYKVNVYPNRLHFELGHNVKDYVKKPNFKIKQSEDNQ